TGVYDLMLKAGFLDSKGGGGKKKKNNIDVPLESVVGSGFLLLVDDTGIVHIQKGGSSSMGQVPDVNTEECEFSHLFTPSGNGVDVVIPVEFIRAISERFTNITYGFFLGKRVANPVVAKYFSSMDGLEEMLENGPWFIRNNSSILKKWNSDVNFLKEDAGNVPVWVKIHGVPVTTFSEDGLSAIATKLCTPLMLDSYTSDMCMQSWGMSSSARAMIELRADVELKDTIMVVMPKLSREGHGFYTCTIRVEYEWKPPRCFRKGWFGTNSMLEQLSDTYENVDYDYDTYDDDMYEGQEMFNLYAII
nr:hypothetical protein [Tanacetum cinerariifolium]